MFDYQTLPVMLSVPVNSSVHALDSLSTLDSDGAPVALESTGRDSTVTWYSIHTITLLYNQVV